MLCMHTPIPQGKIEFSNEDLFEGTFVNGTIEGQGKLTCANGLVYDGKWERSLVSGWGHCR